MCVLPSVRSWPGQGRPGWLHPLKAVMLLAGTCGALALGLVASAQTQASGGYEEVTVQPGDTVWGIATRRYPDSDPRPRVDEILRINGRSDPVLQPGDHLRVPAADRR